MDFQITESGNHSIFPFSSKKACCNLMAQCYNYCGNRFTCARIENLFAA